MRIFIDESGSFQIPAVHETHAAAVVVGVIVPEICEERLFVEFARFLSSLDPSERKGAEPKGARVKIENRRRFCDILASTQGPIVIPITADLSDLVDHAEQFPQRLSKSLQNFSKKCIHQSMRDEMSLLARQAKNLSTTELLKLLLYAECIQECVHHAVAYRSGPPYRDCWSKVEILVDQLGKNSAKREKQVFQTMLLSWLTAWSVRRPLMLIEGVHTPDHPFVQLCETDDGIDMRSLYGDGVCWADSASEPGLQIADIAAAIVFTAVHDLKNERDSWREFFSLMRCCTLVARDGPGLATLVPGGTHPSKEKYAKLVDALGTEFPDRAGDCFSLREPPAWAVRPFGRNR